MLMGYNNDVPYKGVLVHVQTEDHGLPAAKITTQVFFGGAILESRTISYDNEIEGIEQESERDQKIRRLMQAMHKSFFKKIVAGAYDEKLPLKDAELPDPVAEAASEVAAAAAAIDSTAAVIEVSFSNVPAFRGVDEPEAELLAELLTA